MSVEITEIELPSGLMVKVSSNSAVDEDSMRVLIESGTGYAEVARLFKVSQQHVRQLAKKGGWLTPRVVGKMRREIEARQRESLQRNGKALDPAELKARIWEERGERMNEKAFAIVEAALDGVGPERAKKLIQNPLGLAHIVTAGRQVTGIEKKEADEAPRLAVNIGLLRSPRRVAQSVVEAEVVEEER